jgi:amidase
MDELWRWDAVALAAAIRARTVSAREAVKACLERLAAVNTKLNAVTAPAPQDPLAAAEDADRAVARGDALGPLHGVPVAIKENVDQAGAATTNGVEAFAKVIAEVDSPPVANWRKAGAICIGRTNTPAFSLRWHTDNALRGATLNPWAKDRTPGGSSGGSAAAVAAGICPLAHGNDYGGSIRYPAMACGVAGIRPTLGRVPAFNATAPDERPISGQIMSVQGPIARRVRDVRLGLAAMCGPDPRDPWWVPAPLVGAPPQRPIKVAVTVNPAGEAAHPDVAAAVRAAAAALGEAGYAVEEVEPPMIAEAQRLWLTAVAAEARLFMTGAVEKFGDDGIKRAFGYFMDQAGPVDMAAYMKALAARAGVLRAWLLFMQTWPLVLGPVSTAPAFVAGADVTSAESSAAISRTQNLLMAVNYLGLPAAAVPAGVIGGLPQGVQVIASRYREDLALDAAEAIEARLALPTPIDPKF